MKSIASIFIVFYFIAFPVIAEPYHQGYCSNAETTADIVACLSNQHQDAEKKMSDLFSRVERLSPEFEKQIRETQSQWIAYRDSTCDLEGKLYEGGSMQRVQELDCHARMTTHRNHHLKNVIDSLDEAYIPEYSNPPRWVNVLVRDYPNSFWNFGNAVSIDTDCDGQNESVVRGLDIDQKMNIAIADSEKTGRPNITIINFDDQKNCEILPDITIEKLPEPKPEDNMPLSCVQKIIVKTKSCGDFALQYNTDTKSYNIIQ